MKRIITVTLALCLLCALLTACNPGMSSETGAPSTEPIQPTQTLAPTLLPDATESTVAAPQLPAETIPQQPEQDYHLPPGETPSVPPQDK